jgi:hypothetical protein
MKNRYPFWLANLAFLTLCFWGNVATIAQSVSGSNYTQRGTSIVDFMAASSPSVGDAKLVSPYYYAKLYKGVDMTNANNQLETMYLGYINDPNSYYNGTGSLYEFGAHATMHGYLLTKQNLSQTAKDRIKTFLQLLNYTTRTGITLNLNMMLKTTGYLCAEEWPDFVDINGTAAATILATNRTLILTQLNDFYLNSCEEADAYTYAPTNFQYVRMLAEFARDKEVKKLAIMVYQQMISQMLPRWNNGLYAATPPRSKGWENLFTTLQTTNNGIMHLAWLYFGNPNSRPIKQSFTVTNNTPCFVFWSAYKRSVEPLDFLDNMNSSKTYPYVYQAVINDNSGWTYAKTTYQSNNYGLSTQAIIPKTLANSQYTYAYKETKNLHLVWQSTLDDAAVFSVCHDNPERPQANQTVSNAVGYGENPYHRVLQSNRAAIGVYNVATNYMNSPVFYQMYVPFSKTTILQRIQATQNGATWQICHTGKMMFAFLSLEPTVIESTTGKYNIADHTVLKLADANLRRGSWILETTEITPAYKDPNGAVTAELNKFRDALLARTSWVTSADYATGANPMLRYTSLDNDVIELTFYAPDQAYTNQCKINGQTVALNTSNLTASPFMNQSIGGDVVTFNTSAGQKTLLRNPVSALDYDGTSVTYNQNFDDLPVLGTFSQGNNLQQAALEAEYLPFLNTTTGTSLTLPNMKGWQFYKTTTTNPAGIAADDGNGTNGYVKSFGATNATNRSLGLNNTSSLRHAFGLIIRNNTGQTQTSCNIAYTGEQWRTTTVTTPQKLLFSYKTVDETAVLANGINQTSMTAASNLTFTAPITGGVATALDGKNAANRRVVGGTLTGLNWQAGQYLVVRFDQEVNNSSSVAIDDFLFSVGNTVPLSITAISATYKDKNVLVEWQTADEINTDTYDVQKSPDGVHFTTISTIKAQSKSRANTYNYTDSNPFVSVNYYRIQQKDTDGKTFLSKIVSVKTQGDKTVEVYPNPTQGNNISVKMQGFDGSKLTLTLFDSTGRKVLEQTINKANAADTITLTPSVKLASGGYILTVKDASTVKSVKVMIQ